MVEGQRVRSGRRRLRAQAKARRRAASSASGPEFVRRVPEGTPSALPRRGDAGGGPGRLQASRRRSWGRRWSRPAAGGGARSRPARAAGWSFPPTRTTLYADGRASPERREEQDMDKTHEQPRLAAGAARARGGGLQRRHPADDGGQLLGAGHPRPGAARLRRDRVVPQGAERRGAARRAAAAAGLLAGGAGDRDPAGHRAGAGAADAGAGGLGEPGACWRCRCSSHGTWSAPSGRSSPAATSACWACAINRLGIDYNYTADALDAWLTVLVMDVWHWTPLVALLCYAGLRAIPDAYYQAAAHRRRLGVGRVPLHPAAQAARRADHRRAAALHGQLHDLHRALRAHRRRAGQRHHVPRAST